MIMRSALLVLTLLTPAPQEPARGPAAPELEWLLIYYMSYDNNLEACGPVILDGLQEGVKEGRLAVTVLADFRDKEGLRRYVLSPEGRREEKLETEDSASEAVLGSYLAWAAKSHPARRYAIVFLNHGGDLDDMSQDEHPGGESVKQWLSARKVGPLLKEFHTGVGRKVELVFLQQCGRGSIDNLYNFRGSGAAVMASQTTVGAPNTYYAPTLKWLAKNPGVTGAELSRQIMRDDEHYMNYVCVRGEELAELPKRVDAVVGPLLDNPAAPKRQKACFGGQPGGESNHDLLGWLAAAYRANDLPTEELTRLEGWVKEKLISHHEFRSGRRPEKAWCGLSIFVPRSKALRDRYKDYPLYQDSRLDDLWSSMFGE